MYTYTFAKDIKVVSLHVGQELLGSSSVDEGNAGHTLADSKEYI